MFKLENGLSQLHTSIEARRLKWKYDVHIQIHPTLLEVFNLELRK